MSTVYEAVDGTVVACWQDPTKDRTENKKKTEELIFGGVGIQIIHITSFAEVGFN